MLCTPVLLLILLQTIQKVSYFVYGMNYMLLP